LARLPNKIEKSCFSSRVHVKSFIQSSLVVEVLVSIDLR